MALPIEKKLELINRLRNADPELADMYNKNISWILEQRIINLRDPDCKAIYCERLRECRKEKGMTQQDVAESLDISPSTVHRAETGKCGQGRIDLFYLELFSIFYGISPKYLLGLTDSSNKYLSDTLVLLMDCAPTMIPVINDILSELFRESDIKSENKLRTRSICVKIEEAQVASKGIRKLARFLQQIPALKECKDTYKAYIKQPEQQNASIWSDPHYLILKHEIRPVQKALIYIANSNGKDLLLVIGGILKSEIYLNTMFNSIMIDGGFLN